MNRELIVSKVNEIFTEEFEVNENVIVPTANLKESIGLDSLDYVDLVVEIQQAFGLKLTEVDFQEVITIDDFYNLIEKKVLVST